MYRSVADSVNVTISKLALNASYYFHFARYSAYSGRLYGAGEALFVSTYRVRCVNQTGGVGGVSNATQSC